FAVMLDGSGAPLPKEQAVANLWAMYTNKPMVHGPNAGQTMPGSGDPISKEDFAASMTADAEVEGRQRPGRQRPGRQRPGFDRA
ncbi:MAG: hypothetical protein JWM25_600, partial [Thermoleophilia bacterium]|nr:hypothetical protein [Thermoleophilia bacterium]